MTRRRRAASAAALAALLLTGCAARAPARLVVVAPASGPLTVGAAGVVLTVANAADARAPAAWTLRTPSWLAASPANGTLPPGGATPVRLALTGAPPRAAATVRVEGRADGRPLAPLELTVRSRVVDCSGGAAASLRSAVDLGFAPSGRPPRDRLVLAYADPSVAAEVLTRHELELLRSGGGALPDLVALRDPQRAPAARLDALRRDPLVRWVERERALRTLSEVVPTSGDPHLPEQWSLTRFGVPRAWELTAASADGEPVVIAIVDSGVALDHPDLAGRTLPGCDLHDGDADPSPGWDGDRHGSHVAGIAAAARGDGVGVAGVAGGPEARLLPVKVFGDGGGATGSYAVAAAIRWAVGAPVPGFTPTPTPARIVNLSLGAPADGLGPEDARVLREAVAEAERRGALVFAAAGNGGRGALDAPAVFPGAVAVGSVDGTRFRSDFSAFDEDPAHPTVALMAPGGVRDPAATADAGGCRGVISTVPGGYGCASGTSMASPFAAGAAALLWSRHPDWSAARVLARLRESALLPAGADARAFGAGIVCIDRALGATERCGEATGAASATGVR